jgi:hypothetical protein
MDKLDQLPAGRLIKVEVEIRLPVAATREQIEDWINLHFGVGGMDADNPLIDEEPEPFTHEVQLEDTGINGEVEEYDHRRENGKVYFKRRYTRTKATAEL